MHKDVLFGSATLALSVGYYWMASAIPPSQLADAIGPQGLPKAYAILLAVCSLILIGRSLARRPGGRTKTATGEQAQRSPLWRVAGMLAIGVVYILRGVFTPTLTPVAGKSLSTMTYGVVCFAMLLSFVGTVLGEVAAKARALL